MKNPWDFLESYKGRMFRGTWPTLPELFAITVERFPSRKCFTTFDPEHISFTFSEAKEKVDGIVKHLLDLGIQKGDRIAVTGMGVGIPRHTLCRSSRRSHRLYAENIGNRISYGVREFQNPVRG